MAAGLIPGRTETVGQSFATTPGVTYWSTSDTYGVVQQSARRNRPLEWRDGRLADQCSWTDDGFGHLTYTHYTYQVVATAGTSSLTFAFDNGSSNFWLDDVSVSTVPNTEATYGTVTFTDVDTIDTHTVSYQADGSNYGTFTPTLAPANDATGGQSGTVNWTFSVADSALTFLGAQQSVVQTYTVTIADNHGGTATRDVAVTLTNPDHAPVVTSGPQSVSVLEDYSFTVPPQRGAEWFETASQDQDGRSTIILGWTGGFRIAAIGTAPHSGQGARDFVRTKVGT